MALFVRELEATVTGRRRGGAQNAQACPDSLGSGPLGIASQILFVFRFGLCNGPRPFSGEAQQLLHFGTLWKLRLALQLREHLDRFGVVVRA